MNIIVTLASPPATTAHADAVATILRGLYPEAVAIDVDCGAATTVHVESSDPARDDARELAVRTVADAVLATLR